MKKETRNIFIILSAALVVRCISLAQSFWHDEAIQAIVSRNPLFSVNWAADFQPPLFYVFSHFWVKLGIHSEKFLRFPNVLIGVLTVYSVYYFAKKLFNEHVALWSSILLSTSAYHIYYSQEFRMYSLFTLLNLFSWIFLWEKRWKLYSSVVITLIFTHYFGFLVLLSQFFFVLIAKQNLKRFTVSVSIACIPFLFWLPTFLKQIETAKLAAVQIPAWTNVLGVSFWKFPALVIAKFAVGVASPQNTMLYASIVIGFSLLFVLCFFNIIKKVSRPTYEIQNTKYILLLCYLFIPLIVAWLASPFIKANAVHRFVFLLPAFYIFICIGIFQLTQKTKYALLGVVVCINVFFTHSYLYSVQHHRENWREAVMYTDEKVQEGIVLSEFPQPWPGIEWYSKNRNRYLGSTTNLPMTPESINALLSNQIINTNRFILYTYLFEITDPQKHVENYLAKHGYRLVQEKDFRGVGIIKTFLR